MAEPTDSKAPKVRFKGFEGEWKEIPVGSVTRDHIEKTSIQNQYPVLTSSQKHGIVLQKDYFANRQVTTDKNIGYLVLPRGYFTYRSRSDTDSFAFNRNDIIEKGIISYYYPVFEVKDCDSDFFLRRINFGVQRQLSIAAEGTGQRVLAHSQFKKLATNYPTLPEQTQIGGYFREVDRLIGLQQRKHDKLVTLKKAMLRKMFPQPGTTTPEVRFQGFSGAWVEKKLGDSTTNVTNNTLSRTNLNPSSGLARNVHYGDILIRFGEVLDLQTDSVPFVSDDAVATKLKSSNLKNGDIVIADAAEDETVGKCTEIQNVGDQIVLAGLHTIALRPLFRFAPFYLGYYLNSNAFHVQLLPIMQGTKVLSISKTAIKQTVICFPPDPAEQQKIGHYFRTLDELISRHALQLKKLEQIKAACLERMFV